MDTRAVVSASRRTDIPAFFAADFARRLDDGFALAVNPRNAGQSRIVALDPDSVACFVFWTKNPAPFSDVLSRLERDGRPSLFQITVTPYEWPFEPGVPAVPFRIAALRALSRITGPRRVTWRYDPVFFAPGIDASWHVDRFTRLCESLAPFARECVASALDPYPFIAARLGSLSIRVPAPDEAAELFARLADVAAGAGLRFRTCCEAALLAIPGIERAACVDAEAVAELVPGWVPASRRPLREGCGCAASVDIGSYGTCPAGCAYCYATRGRSGNAAGTVASARSSTMAARIAAPMAARTETPRGGSR